MFGRRLRLAGAAALIAALLPAAVDAQYWSAPRYERGEYRRPPPPPPGFYEHGGDRGDPRGEPYRGRARRCDRGTGGTILGAIAGGLLGNSVAGRGDRNTGTIVGAGVGALAGRAVDRDC